VGGVPDGRPAGCLGRQSDGAQETIRALVAALNQFSLPYLNHLMARPLKKWGRCFGQITSYNNIDSSSIPELASLCPARQ